MLGNGYFGARLRLPKAVRISVWELLLGPNIQGSQDLHHAAPGALRGLRQFCKSPEPPKNYSLVVGILLSIALLTPTIMAAELTTVKLNADSHLLLVFPHAFKDIHICSSG